ncbi:ATP-binding protein [Kitasatospora sp. NPDC054939]
MTGPAGVYRVTVAATAWDAAERCACISPARAVLRTVATGWGVTGPVLDDLVTAAGELLSNAALHAGPGRIPVRLWLSPDGEWLRIEVDTEPPPSPAR